MEEEEEKEEEEEEEGRRRSLHINVAKALTARTDERRYLKSFVGQVEGHFSSLDCRRRTWPQAMRGQFTQIGPCCICSKKYASYPRWDKQILESTIVLKGVYSRRLTHRTKGDRNFDKRKSSITYK